MKLKKTCLPVVWAKWDGIWLSNDVVISVEIESYSEVESHPEHVLLNMKKWKEMGFSGCHVWSTHKQVVEIKDKINSTFKDNDVKVFLVWLSMW